MTAPTQAFVPGSWHSIVFYSDQATSEVARFASALRKKFEVESMPTNCGAWRHENHANSAQTVYLSPRASALANELPTYRALLESVSLSHPSNNSAFKEMHIFA